MPHRRHPLPRAADGVVTSGQWFRHAEQGLSGRSFDGTESRHVGQARRDPRLSGVPLARTELDLF